MKSGIFIFVFFFSLYALAFFNPQERLEHFSFGSCNKHNKAQPHWQMIQNNKPQFFLWVGDAYYADTEEDHKLEKVMLSQFNHPDYIPFRKDIPILGVWDDHDYGDNDVGMEYPLRLFTQQVYLDFLEEPLNSKRRYQQGIYSSYDIGEAKILLLDVRYYRDIKSSPKGDLIGERQWRWLEKELKESDAKIHFIVSGSTVLTPLIPIVEQWRNHREDFQRLFQTLKNVPGVIFLSGDAHFAGVLFKKVKGRRYPEFMASGLTHSHKGLGQELIRMYWGAENVSFDKNYGDVRIRWEEPIVVSYESRSIEKDKISFRKSFQLKENGDWQLLEEPSLDLAPRSLASK